MCYVKWCLHGVHCEQEKLTPPFTQRLSSLELHLFGWSYCGVILIAKNISSSYLAYKRCAHLSHFWGGSRS